MTDNTISFTSLSREQLALRKLRIAAAYLSDAQKDMAAVDWSVEQNLSEAAIHLSRLEDEIAALAALLNLVPGLRVY